MGMCPHGWLTSCHICGQKAWEPPPGLTEAEVWKRRYDEESLASSDKRLMELETRLAMAKDHLAAIADYI